MIGYRLEKRAQPSRTMRIVTPAIAIALTMGAGAGLFALVGSDPSAVFTIFFRPLLDPNRWQDLAIKAAPLALIALGLSFGFRANVWNIGAEGQFVLGGLGATGVALATWGTGESVLVLPAMMLAGMLAGVAWAALPALLRARWGVSEILTSLMLVYVAIQLLNYLMRGPWKDPEGFNFPQSRMFEAHQTLPIAIEGTIVHWGAPIVLGLCLVGWLVASRSVFGFRMTLTGQAPAAAAFAGFAPERTIWAAMAISGAAAGLAGAFEAAGGFGQMTPQFATGYGFTAIIVAFLGRLHPAGVIAASLILAVIIVGGEGAQSSMNLPAASTSVFQAMALFFLLAGDLSITHRIVRRERSVA